jgi:soluble lytic murein transglycosylase
MKRFQVLPSIGLLLALSSSPTLLGQAEPVLWRRVTDAALDELAAGRFWHAARLLREEGAQRGSPDRVLLLARAEAGWRNWPAVAELLDGSPWLPNQDEGEGLLLLGRALEAQGQWAEAAKRYEGYLALLRDEDVRRSPLLARLARVRAGAGDMEGAVLALDAVPSRDVSVRSWAAVELTEGPAVTADTVTLRRLHDRIVDGQARSATWRQVPDARLAVHDSAGAERAFRAARVALRGDRRAEASSEIGLLTLARGDTSEARDLLVEGAASGSWQSRGRAAAALIQLGGADLEATLELGRILDRSGDGANALRAYDRAVRLLENGPAGLPGWARLSRARLMATVRALQDDAVEEFRAIHASSPDDALGARNLEVWMALRRRQGRLGDVNTLRGWLLDRFPGSSQAAEVLWERGSSAESRGDLESALEQYARLAEVAPTLARSGQARMRAGQIHYGAHRLQRAAEVYEAYLADFPGGRRWEEASYWAARARLEDGDTVAARRWIETIRIREPVSYYAVIGSALLGEPYHVELAAGASAEEPGWLSEGLRRLDLLMAAGLLPGAEAEESRLIGRARGSHSVTLTLAEALIDRGRTVAGINLGWALRGAGVPWDRRLAQVVYPFPYRELVRREAEEWGVDPIMLAALIRQESAFEADIVSTAGAVGLMQVMPSTGKELARAYGPAPFAPVNLTAPEVNLHLGAAFFVEMNGRYGGVLPLVLSAYNAGPTRATRWRRFPEVTDPARFTERIPFDETRGYVKNVSRNLGLYQVLYGQQ